MIVRTPEPTAEVQSETFERGCSVYFDALALWQNWEDFKKFNIWNDRRSEEEKAEGKITAEQKTHQWWLEMRNGALNSAESHIIRSFAGEVNRHGTAIEFDEHLWLCALKIIKKCAATHAENGDGELIALRMMAKIKRLCDIPTGRDPPAEHVTMTREHATRLMQPQDFGSLAWQI